MRRSRKAGMSHAYFYKRLRHNAASDPPATGIDPTPGSLFSDSSDSCGAISPDSVSLNSAVSSRSNSPKTPRRSSSPSLLLPELPELQRSESVEPYESISNDEWDVSESETCDDSAESETDTNSVVEDEAPEELNFKEKLAYIIVSHDCSEALTRDLLTLLREDGKTSLPKTRKGLLQTPTEKIPTRQVEEGEYYHIGIQNSLCEFEEDSFLSRLEEIEIHVGIDGCPLSKSNPCTIWPILISFPSHKDISPVLIGIYSGPKDPKNPDEFLKEFILEVRDLSDNGVLVTKARILKRFRISAVISDSKARPMLTSVVGYTAGNGCGYCDQLAITDGNRLVFSIQKGNPRTDFTYRERLDPKHHKTQEKTLLESLDLNMIDNFPLCPMHLVYLGVVRTLGVLWTTPKSKFFRLTPTERSNLNVAHLQCASFMPSEFSRKLDSTSYIGRWKATQCRQFLIYNGPVVLKRILDQEHYEHFLLLSSAIRILSSEALCANSRLIGDFLVRFFRP